MKAMQPFWCILSDVIALQKHSPFSADCSPGNRYNQLEPSQESRGDVSVLSHCFLLRNSWPKLTGVLEHCCVGDSNFGSPFFGTFPSDHMPKVMKDVNVHDFIHSFTFSDELIMESAPAVKNNFQHNLSFSPITSKVLLWDDYDFNFVCGSCKKHHVSSPVIMLLRTLLSLSAVSMRPSEMLIRVSFYLAISIWGTDRWQMLRMFNTSWRILWQLLTEIPISDAVGPQIFFCSHDLSHMLNTFFICWHWWVTTAQIIVNTLVSNMEVFMPGIHQRFSIALSPTIRLLQHD